jgi:4-hydroxy-tetrahydrodipicolinate synthase
LPTFGRVLTAMATPFTESLELDLDGAQRLAAHLVDRGSDGLVVAGTTGESPTLTHDETLDLFTAVVEAVGDRVTVVGGVGKNDTAATVTLAGEAQRRGLDGVLVVTPYYNKPNQRGLEHHFTAVAAAVDLPVLLYNIPSRTAREIEPATLLRLAETVDNIKGVKDAVGDFTKTAWLAARKPADFDILSGDDASLLPLLAVGGVGIVAVASHVVGEDLARMVEVYESDPGEARSIHFRLLPLLTTLMTADPNPAPVKAALELLGLPAGPLRPPLVRCDETAVAAVREALAAAGVEVPR